MGREERGSLPEGEHFRSDLIGCVVHDLATGQDIGRVEGIEQYGGPPLLAVSAAGRQVLIPFVPEICQRVDIERKAITGGFAGRIAGPVGGMKFHILTIFPEFFRGPFEHGVVAKAQQAGRLEIQVHDLRHWTYDRHRTVDDRPFGGGEGMLLKPQPLV